MPAGSARPDGSRLAIGPLVLAVAVVGAGITDVTTLTIPPAAPLVILAMAFAALTPGYPIAAVFMVGASASVMVAHWQVTQGGRPRARAQ